MNPLRILRHLRCGARPRLLGVVTAAALAAACGEPGTRPLAEEHRPVANAALDYLESTEDELGLDVVIAIQAYGEVTGDPRAAEVADARASAFPEASTEPWAGLLAADKPPLPRARLGDGPEPAAPPRPADELGDDRAARCPVEVLECRVSGPCRELVELEDRGGYVLTHQGLWLIFAHWMGCSTDVDVDARRAQIAARLVAETGADPEPSDLYVERLAILGHLGYAAEIERAWIDALVEAQQPEGCFPASAAVPCHPHPTGLALWSLAHAPR